jgi:polar amino acid transport system substrate-binding protein
MIRYPSRAAIVAALTAIAAALAGCGAISDQALHTSLHGLDVVVHTTTSSTTSTSVPPCNPTASLRPTGPLPAPGHMPARSFMRTIQQHGHLIAGVNESYLLFGSFVPSAHKIEGFEIDLLHAIAKQIFGNKPNALVLEALTTGERFSVVQSGQVDIVADAVTMTCMRWQLVDFSTTYYDGGVGVMVPIGSPVHQLRDLAHKRVCAAKPSVPLDLIESSPYKLIPYPVQQGIDCLVALQEGKVDAIFTDRSILLGYRLQDPNVKILPFSVADAPYGMAINKSHTDFVRFVNAVLERMRRDGQWASIYRQWLAPYTGGRTPPPPPPVYMP